MKPLKNWRTNLRNYILQNWTTEFEYGDFDCMLFCGGAVFAMTGVDYIKQLTPEYSNLKEGLAYLKKKGYNNHIELIEHLFEEVPPAFAQVGDIAVLKGDDTGQALGIVQGDMVYVLTQTGIAPVRRKYITRAFRVLHYEPSS